MPSSDTASVSDSFAASSARDGFSGVVGNTDPSSVSLVSFTDTERGTELKDGTIDPTYVDRTAWAVTFSAIELRYPRGATEIAEGTDASGVNIKGTLVVFIDANSGKYLEALGLNGIY